MKRSLILVVVLFPLLGLVALLHTARLQASPPQSGGVTFTVNSTIDATDANPGDGVCETAVGNGVCTLRAAVQETNALPGADVINLPSGTYTITIAGSDFDSAVGDLNITDELIIAGEDRNTTVINGNEIDRIFDVRMSPGKQVTLHDLAVINGSTPNPGGGICHCTMDTRLYLNRIIVRDNQSFSFSGGVDNVGYIEIIDSIIQENFGGSSGGGIGNAGTGILSKTIIVSNTAPYDGLGGGIMNSGILTVTDSTVHGNSVAIVSMGSNGGGIFNSGAAAEIILENSTISRNSAVPSFGGFANYGGIARLINVTVSENEHGGIIQFNGGTMFITNTTIVSNTHIPPFQVSLRVADGSATLVNSIIAGETPADNCDGLITSAGHNLESGNSCGLNNTGDITNTNPILGPLQANGGDTWTHALLTGSPAIDAGEDNSCPATDQRGIPRPVGDHCDMGAYEYNVALTAIDDEVATQQNTPLLIDVLANDIAGPNGDPSLDSVGLPMSGTAVITNTFILYTPDLDFTGTDTFTYTITDGVVTDTAVVTVTVLPLIAPTAIDDIAETNQNEPILINVLANDLPGGSGDPVLDSVGAPMSGTAVITNSFILYTPAPDFFGTDTFTYTITDGVLTDTAVVTVTVLPVNDQTFIYLPVVLKPEE